MDTLLPNVAAEAPETQQQSLYYLLSPVEAHRHVHPSEAHPTPL
jgi:hypothetical protein